MAKNDCDIWNQHPRICRNAKNCTKQKQTNKKSNLGPKMPCLGILKCKFEKVLSYLKSASSNLPKCQKEKSLTLGPKMPDLVVFRL